MRDCIEVGLVHNPSSTVVWLGASARLGEDTRGLSLRNRVNALSDVASTVFQDSTRTERTVGREDVVNA